MAGLDPFAMYDELKDKDVRELDTSVQLSADPDEPIPEQCAAGGKAAARKRRRAQLRKKLRQIEQLKDKQAQGAALEENQSNATYGILSYIGCFSLC